MATAPRRAVGCNLVFNFVTPSVLALQVAPACAPNETFEVVGARDPEEVLVGPNRTHVLRAGAGEVSVSYRATVEPDTEVSVAPVSALAEEVLVARRQSRYCPSDTVADFAARELRGVESVDEVDTFVGAWVHDRLAYLPGASTSADTAIDTLLAGRGVCRDFAHLAITMLRAINVPARMVSVYAPGISPMDFHAVVEVWCDGKWRVIDPTRLAPRPALVRIATGRDAADTAFAATLEGDVELVAAEVFAVVEGDLPRDDHGGPTTLR